MQAVSVLARYLYWHGASFRLSSHAVQKLCNAIRASAAQSQGTTAKSSLSLSHYSVSEQERHNLYSLTLTWGITQGSGDISQLASSRSPRTHLDPAGTLSPCPTNLLLNTPAKTNLQT